MSKKFNSALEALNNINRNTEDTNATLKDLLLQEKKASEQLRRDKILEDSKDKSSGVSKGVKAGSSIAKAAGNTGPGKKLKELGGMIASLVALEALMNLPQILEKFNVDLKELGGMLESSVRTLATLPVMKAILKKPPKKPTTLKGKINSKGGLTADELKKANSQAKLRADAEAKAKAQIEAEAKKPKELKGKINQKGMSVSEIKAADLEVRTRQQIAKNAFSKSPTVKTDIGELKMNKGGRLYNVDTNKFVKMDEGLKAIEQATAPKMPSAPSVPDVPKFDTSVPKKGFGKKALEKTGKAIEFIPGVGWVKGGLKIASKVAAPIGVGVDSAMGYYDKDYKSAGYSGIDRAGLGLIEGFADVADFGVNVATGVGGMFTGEGFRQGYQNNIDLSERAKDFALTERGKSIYSLGRMGSWNGDKPQVEATPQATNIKPMQQVNDLAGQFANASSAQQQQQLITKIQDLIDAMGEEKAGAAVAMVNNVTTHTSQTAVPLKVDLPEYD